MRQKELEKKNAWINQKKQKAVKTHENMFLYKIILGWVIFRAFQKWWLFYLDLKVTSKHGIEIHRQETRKEWYNKQIAKKSTPGSHQDLGTSRPGQ